MTTTKPLLQALFVLVASSNAMAAGERHLRQLSSRKGTIKPKQKASWERRFVSESSSLRQNHRHLLQNGHVFIVNQEQSQGVDWCMDAVNGVIREDGSFPSLGFRPCAFNAGPSEQLFRMYNDGTIRSKLEFWRDDICLIVEDGLKTPEVDDRVRIGTGSATCNRPGAKFVYGHDYNESGRIKVASNTDLCLVFEGDNHEDNDRIILADCEGDNSKQVQWMFRTGWYELYSGEGCVAVRDQQMEEGNRVILDNCSEAGFGGHWRIDHKGLFHNRLDDNFCMEAEEEDGTVEAGAAVRIEPCNEEELNQRWEWPDGFEAPISLKSKPSLSLVVQGNTEEEGDPMVLEEMDYEWSSDAVHR